MLGRSFVLVHFEAEPSHNVAFQQFVCSVTMPHAFDDMQLLRLIKAFQKITDQHVRRMVVRLVEEKLEKQQLPSKVPGGETRDLT